MIIITQLSIIIAPSHIINNNILSILNIVGATRLFSLIYTLYCYFGIEADKIGLEVEGLEFPVCNIFQAKVLNDQLCYEVDINEMIKRTLQKKI